MSTNQTSINPMSLDRGAPQLQGREKSKTSVTKVFVWGTLFAALVIIIVMAMIFIKRYQGQKEETAPTKQVAEVSAGKNLAREQKEIAELEAMRKAQEAEAAAAAEQEELPAPKDAPIGVQASGGQGAGGPAKPPRHYQGHLLVNKGDSKNSGAVRPVAAAGFEQHPGFQEASTSGGEKLDGRLQPSNLASARASLRPDLSMLLRRGTMIPCVQQSAIVTNHPSLILCRTTKDIYSANGRVLLIERGSTVIGEQRTQMQRGQKTIYAIWTRIETDKGVSIDVNSPASNPLGAAGIDAHIDNHWWERFGNAILMTIVGDVMDGMKRYYSERGNSSGSFYPQQTQDQTESMATEALKDSIKIPPTGYSNQGSQLNIFVARDVDFRDVYRLISED